jgi:hypothetical protein
MHDDPLVLLRGLLGATWVGDGPTGEQRRVLQSLATGYLGLDVLLDSLEPCGPDEMAAGVGAAGRHRAAELLVLIEFCRHPADPRQADLIETYLEPLGGEDLAVVARDVQAGHRERVSADWARFREAPAIIPGISDDDLSGQIRSLESCPPGSLGRGLFDFYVDLGVPFPGEPDGGDVSLAHHDVTHVLTGYGTTPQDEVALEAMLTAASGFDHHFSGLVASLALFEAAALDFPGFVPKEAVIDRPGAADELADAFRRGAACTGDVSTVDFLARREEPLAAIQAEFGVVPPPRR